MIAKRARLILATTCADRKAVIAQNTVRLREIPRDLTGRERARRWAARLRNAEGGRAAADRLYQGDHWSSSRRALEAAAEAGFAAELWVISAGYGLYPAEAPVAAYAATFTAGHADSVVPRSVNRCDRAGYLSAWWYSVADHVQISGAKARTFRELARLDRDARILVVAGESYLDAIVEDLTEAAQELRNPDQLAVISGGATSRREHPLSSHLLPVDARFQRVVGGTRSALNARVAHWLLSGVADPPAFGLSSCRTKVERVGATLPAPESFDRKPMTDSEVRRWIAANRTRVERASASALLRVLRDSGLACEQKRFGRLFRGLVNSPNGRHQ